MATTTATWDEDKVSIKNIVLDKLNPRIDDTIPRDHEADLIHYIIQNTNSEKLAREVVDKQDLPELEALVLIRDGDKYIVLEGNRRMAVYKCLLNPALAPESKRKTFETLSKRVGFTQAKKLRSHIAPSREAAAPLLRSKHVETYVERWDPRMKANFDKRYLSQGGPSKANLRRAELYAMVKKLDLPPDVRKIVDNDKEFAFTTLDRVVFSSAGQEFLGFHIGDNGKIKIDIEKSEFEKGLKKIVRDVANKVVEPKNDFGRTVEGMRKKYFPQIPREYVPNKSRPAIEGTEPTDINDSEGSVTPGTNEEGKGVVELGESLPAVVMPPKVPAHTYTLQEALAIIENICIRFNLVQRNLQVRYNGRATLTITDEYDVQDLFESLLKLYFDDVRREEYTPSQGGKSNRFDILLRQDKVGLEIKMTRKGLIKESQVADQIILDIPRYKTHPNCSYLICFVYDPEAYLNNPKGLEADINEMSDKKFGVKLIVNQNH